MEIPDMMHIPAIFIDDLETDLFYDRSHSFLHKSYTLGTKQITLQKLQKADVKQFDESSKRLRAHHGVIYLPEGTTANNACIHITERQKVATGSAGIWLLQSRPLDAQGNPMDGTDFENIKDSKHLLSESNEYAALYYTGPDIYLM